jgi:dTDP-glucose 4,6-dehydratase
MKNILVTGADGFIGSHLVELLVNQGYNVNAFVFYNSFNSWGWLDTLPKEIMNNVNIISGDIRDPFQIKRAMENCDTVFHLAALIAIPYSYNSPQSYVDTNISGTLNVLEAARSLSIQRVMVTSTSEVYGTAKYTPIDEKHDKQAQSPYSATKIAADALAISYFNSFNTPVTIVRPFNTYGPRQSARAVIPTIISQLKSGYIELNLGSLSPTRDFNFVTDTCNGFLQIALSENTIGEEINISTEVEISIKDLASELIAQINPSAYIVEKPERLRPDKSEVERLLGSNEKIKRLTSWEPKYSFKQGISETIEWFDNPLNLSKYKPNIYNK